MREFLKIKKFRFEKFILSLFGCSIKKNLGVMYDSKFMQLKSFISEVARLCSKEMQVSHQNPHHLADAEVVPEV